MSSEAKRPILLLLVVLASAASAVAGYDEGMSAYRAGDYERALLELLDAASQGHPKAEYRLGCMYDAGKGVAIDPVEAARWLHRSAEQGHAPAQSYLGYLHREGRGVEQDYEESARWYRMAADQDFSPAQNGLGWLMCCVEGAPHYPEEAVRLFRAAAATDNHLAILNLGNLYAAGRGVEQDRAEALRWYCRGLVLEAEGAQRRVDWIVPQLTVEDQDRSLELAYADLGAGEPAAAYQQVRRLAHLGHAGGQYALGMMHLRGEGASRSDEQAYRWLTLAAQQSHTEATAEAERLEALLTPTAAARAGRRADEWVRAENPISEEGPREYGENEPGVEIPVIITKAPPKYPEQARKKKLTGQVIIGLLVDREGSPTNLQILRVIEPGVGFEEAALAAVQQWRYRPGTFQGEVVPVRMTTVLEFIMK